uniref:ATP synthase subunit a n=1 Tax=Gregariella coralliophaga TaxID=2590089 RepID=A0A516EZH2_9BIVA|nr:ATP synthase F0 subunit 6 [Gregariella coralliophaga]QDO71899.1 ATP synthase F0 subunit 6 [Gregariella coralliophaga]
MMMDVFSSFDGHSFNFFGVGAMLWLFSTLTPFMVIFGDVWMKSGTVSKFRNFLLVFSFSMLRSNGKGLMIAGLPLGVSSLFLLVLMLNLSGNVPYFFPVSAHFVFGFSFAFSFWTCLVISGMVSSFEQSFMSLVPSGCPLILIPFMVVVEIFSGMLRPLTLVLRLSLNLSAGKVILSLLGSGLLSSLLKLNSISSFYNIFGVIISGGIFAVMEIIIACIQCYIFCVLITLYSGDHSD